MEIPSGFPLLVVSFLISLTPSMMHPLRDVWWDSKPWIDSIEAVDSPSKRSPDGMADWPICPSEMDRVDCFYTYLEMYVRLRQQMKDEPTRTIGKRFDVSQPRYGCPEDVEIVECLRSIFLS